MKKHRMDNPKLKSYLEDGTGKPCAGHVSEVRDKLLTYSLFKSSWPENFGLELPTASTNKVMRITHLNVGIGEP